MPPYPACLQMVGSDLNSPQSTLRDVLRSVSFGARIAEEEAAELREYFVETDQWQRIFQGAIDIVYGPKGSGKSAVYSLLLDRADDLFDRGILVVGAENPRGATVFKDLVTDPPATEEEFRSLWKLYVLSLVGKQLREYAITGSSARRVIDALGGAGLLEHEFSLPGLLRAVREYVRRLGRPREVEGGLKLDPTTSMPVGVTGKIVFGEPDANSRRAGWTSADELLRVANDALMAADVTVWVLLDRLDVAFAEAPDLEANALRALFRVYLDLAGLDAISLKIFLRDDVWRRITEQGFREASHVTRHVTISWSAETLLNLVVRRLLRNLELVSRYGADPAVVLAEASKQRDFFYRVFPKQIDSGPNKPSTFEWMRSRTWDGAKKSAPRELIHLLSSAREGQLQMLEVGHMEPPEHTMFERQAIKDALPPVAKTRLEQTLYAEYPSLRPYIQKLEGAKTQQSVETLARLWGLSCEEARGKAVQLVEVGFFERRGTREQPLFWVPFLYRVGLDMVQGSETGVAATGAEEEDEG
jgi:hypothetical protein